ncbi:MAG: hypothetical protein P8M72_08135 [Gammaproteobacteria bacterium]|nr:hypothetical protein [Gammaproteobacteria bacterium]
MKLYILLLIVLTSFLLTDKQLYAQNSDTEILDTDSMSMSKLRREIRGAQSAMYDIYNELNEDDEYDIECTETRSARSLIRERVCMPNFMSTSLSEAARDFVGGQTSAGAADSSGGGSISSASSSHLSQSLINEKNQTLAEIMVELGNANIELNIAFTTMKILNDAYQARVAAGE